MQDLDSVLVTGGTGTFGQQFIREVLKRKPNISRLVVYSRDELKQHDMAQEFDPKRYPGLRYFLGDVRDCERTKMAMEGVKTVVHAAALKQVPAGEYNPSEFIKTNIIGAENIIAASLASGVSRVVALSTDKACSPSSLYGATKLCSDRLFVAANNIKGEKDITFSLVRYGNVFGSRGSVVPQFLKQLEAGLIKITDPEMTRFSISLKQGVAMVFLALERSYGGETLVPKIPSYRVADVAEAVAPGCDIEIIGPRIGEKKHEEMINSGTGELVYDVGQYFIILPNGFNNVAKKYEEKHKAELVKAGFVYNSGINDHFLTIDEIRSQVSEFLGQ